MLKVQFDGDVLAVRPEGPITRDDVAMLTRTADYYLVGHPKIAGRRSVQRAQTGSGRPTLRRTAIRLAYEEANQRTSTSAAPWFVITADHKWFRNLATAQIISDTMDDMGLKLPAPRVDLAEIQRKYHAAADEYAPTMR